MDFSLSILNHPENNYFYGCEKKSYYLHWRSLD